MNIQDKIIDGKKIAEDMKKEIAAEVADMVDHGKPAPHLAALLVGDDGASKTYVANKEKSCQLVGMTSSVYRLPETASASRRSGSILIAATWSRR